MKAKHTLTIADKLTLGDVFKGEQYDYIVKAVNSHDKIVEALRASYRALTLDSDMEEDFAPEIKLIKQALKKAGV